MRYELREVRIHEDQSESSTCFSAKLFGDEHFIASVRNEGKGGKNDVFFAGLETQKEFTRFAESRPPVVIMGSDHAMTVDLFIDQLIWPFLHVDELRRFLRGTTAFRIPSDKYDGQWRLIAQELTPELRAQLVKAYGDGCVFAADLLERVLEYQKSLVRDERKAHKKSVKASARAKRAKR